MNQTPEVHEALAEFLEQVRRTQDTEIDIAVKFIYLSDAALKKCGLDLKLPDCCEGACPVGKKKAWDCLNPRQVEKLLAVVQKDPKTSVSQSPRLMTLNAQAGVVRVDHSEKFVTGLDVTGVEGQLVFQPKQETLDLGVDIRVEPTLTPDEQSITLDVAAAVKELAVLPVPMTPVTVPVRPVFENGKEGEIVPFTQFIQRPRVINRRVAEKLTVADGGTVVLYGGKATVERTHRESPPMLSDVLFLNHIFAREKKETTTNHLLVLVTAKAIKPASCCEQCGACSKADNRLPKLLGDYGRACKTGNVEEARRLAIECLAIDPMCFDKK